jgi:hypothetical protein
VLGAQRRGLGRRLRAQVEHGHRRALRFDAQRGRLPDARARAGDHATVPAGLLLPVIYSAVHPPSTMSAWPFM